MHSIARTWSGPGTDLLPIISQTIHFPTLPVGFFTLLAGWVRIASWLWSFFSFSFFIQQESCTISKAKYLQWAFYAVPSPNNPSQCCSATKPVVPQDQVLASWTWPPATLMVELSSSPCNALQMPSHAGELLWENESLYVAFGSTLERETIQRWFKVVVVFHHCGKLERRIKISLHFRRLPPISLDLYHDSTLLL